MTNRELAETLWQKRTEEAEYFKNLDYFSLTILGSVAETVYILLQDDKDCPIYPYACMEMLSHMQGRHPQYIEILKDAIEGFENLPSKGLPKYDVVKLHTEYVYLCKRNTYLSQINDDADYGKWSESVRRYIDGFDLINGKIGSFHDSQVLPINIDHEEGVIDLKLYMCNGANCIVVIRFEDCTDYNISTDAMPVYLYFGYFFEENGFLTLDLDPLGNISAKHARVISITPIEQE